MKIFRSELTKLVSTPSNLWMLAIYCAIAALLGFAFARFIGSAGFFGPDAFFSGLRITDVIRTANVFGLVFAMGVLLVAGEARHGLLSQTFVTSSACRQCVLAAKAGVGALAGLTMAAGGMVASVAGAGIAVAIGTDGGLSLGPNLARSVLGVIAVAVFFALIGLGLGAAVPSPNLAIAGGLVWILAADGLVSTFVPALQGVLLSQAMGHLLGIGANATMWRGAAVLASWTVLLGAAGALLLDRRDLTD